MQDISVITINELRDRRVQPLAIGALHQQNRAIFHVPLRRVDSSALQQNKSNLSSWAAHFSFVRGSLPAASRACATKDLNRPPTRLWSIRQKGRTMPAFCFLTSNGFCG